MKTQSPALHYLLFLVVIIYLSVLTCSAQTLRHANLLYRHGDRSPINIYPKDINQLDVWPDGPGWLSNIGKEQQYKVGQYLRGRYGGFINITRYDHRQISIESSAVERCLMSAYSNLAGFFPPQGDQVWNTNLKWQAIPVETRPQDIDRKLAMSAKCPRYDQLLAESYLSKQVRDYEEKNKVFFKNVSLHTGLNESLANVWQVYDTLVCERDHNMTWNKFFYEDGVFEILKDVDRFAWDLLYLKPEMAKLKGGPLLKEMIENMKAATNSSYSGPKMHMYSAHDSTVSALTQAMTVFNGKQPPYRTLVMVELHRMNNKDMVKVFFRNDTTRDPYDLQVPGCDNPCPLAKFESLLKDRIPQDWEKECKVDNSSNSGLSLASWIALIVGALVGLLFIIGLFILCRRQRHAYTRV